MSKQTIQLYDAQGNPITMDVEDGKITGTFADESRPALTPGGIILPGQQPTPDETAIDLTNQTTTAEVDEQGEHEVPVEDFVPEEEAAPPDPLDFTEDEQNVIRTALALKGPFTTGQMTQALRQAHPDIEWDPRDVHALLNDLTDEQLNLLDSCRVTNPPKKGAKPTATTYYQSKRSRIPITEAVKAITQRNRPRKHKQKSPIIQPGDAQYTDVPTPSGRTARIHGPAETQAGPTPRTAEHQDLAAMVDTDDPNLTEEGDIENPLNMDLDADAESRLMDALWEDEDVDEMDVEAAIGPNAADIDAHDDSWSDDGFHDVNAMDAYLDDHPAPQALPQVRRGPGPQPRKRYAARSKSEQKRRRVQSGQSLDTQAGTQGTNKPKRRKKVRR